MDPQILIILFLLFGVISSLINKLQERRQQQPDESKLRRKSIPSQQTRPADPFDEDDVDWDEWNIATEPTQSDIAPEREPEPLPTPPEFQPVQGKRQVSEESTEPEFHDIRGARPVEEPETGIEFRAVEATRPVSDQSSYVEGKTPIIRASMRRIKRRKRNKRRLNLDFKIDTVRKAIIFNEIIGPPRADNMPF